MNSETNTPTEMNPLTEAIVTAAKQKRVRKPKTPSIVEEIISDLRSGKYTQESLAVLARLFNREFVAEPADEKKPRKSKKDTPVDESAPEAPAPAPKEKKPRKSKNAESAPVEESAPEAPAPAPKEKKPRKSKNAESAPVEESAPKEKKDTPVEESQAPAPKEKKPRKSKKDVEESAPIEETAPKEKKPRKSKKSVDESAPIEESAPKEKKPRKSTKETAKTSTPVLENVLETLTDELPNLDSRLEGFLSEEELSDIEDEDDE